MADVFDGEAGQVDNVKDRHYSMEKSWESRNNMEMNKMMKYNEMSDQANVPHPATKMHGEKANKQLGPQAEDNNYNYNDDRS